MTALPNEVVERDRRLQRSADELMELRWHWTLNEANPDRVSIADYAREVGVGRPRVSMDANAWADWLKIAKRPDVRTPGTPQNAQDIRELKNLGEQRAGAAQAIAKATGASLSNVAAHKREEIDAVLSTAQERALDRGTTVEHEINRAADWRAKARKAAEREQDERRARSTMRFVEIEGHIGAAMQRLRKVLDTSQDVDFNDEERELINESLSKLRALLNLIDLRIAGETQIDWDTELQKLVN